MKARRHMFIPDTQIKPGVPLDHLTWIGRYAAEKRPDVIVQIGDWYDLPSLSSYDKGKRTAEGRRFNEEVDVGNLGWEMVNEPIEAEIAKSRRSRRKVWRPDRRYCLGNHEKRAERYADDHPEMAGTVGYDRFKHPGWQRHEFLELVEIDGITYSHYFANKQSGRPLSGQSIDTRIRAVGSSFSMGHQQVLLFGRRETYGKAHYGLVAGNCYLHDEDYRGIQANDEWRGIVIKNQVEDGTYDPMFVSLDFLCRKYEGERLNDFLIRKYGKGIQ